MYISPFLLYYDTWIPFTWVLNDMTYRKDDYKNFVKLNKWKNEANKEEISVSLCFIFKGW